MKMILKMYLVENRVMMHALRYWGRWRWWREVCHSAGWRDRELLMPTVILWRHLVIGPQVIAAVRVGAGVPWGQVVGWVDWHSSVVHLCAVLHFQSVVTVLGAWVNNGAAVGRTRCVVVVVKVVGIAVAPVLRWAILRPATSQMTVVHSGRRRRGMLL